MSHSDRNVTSVTSDGHVTVMSRLSDMEVWESSAQTK